MLFSQQKTRINISFYQDRHSVVNHDWRRTHASSAPLIQYCLSYNSKAEIVSTLLWRCEIDVRHICWRVGELHCAIFAALINFMTEICFIAPASITARLYKFQRLNSYKISQLLVLRREYEISTTDHKFQQEKHESARLVMHNRI